jgi:hypothetical protein
MPLAGIDGVVIKTLGASGTLSCTPILGVEQAGVNVPARVAGRWRDAYVYSFPTLFITSSTAAIFGTRCFLPPTHVGRSSEVWRKLRGASQKGQKAKRRKAEGGRRPNYYHLALGKPEPNLATGMHWLQTTFAIRHNRFRRRHGHLFQGRFKSLLIQDTIHLARVDYIHLNPVRAGIVRADLLVEFRASLCTSYRALPYSLKIAHLKGWRARKSNAS